MADDTWKPDLKEELERDLAAKSMGFTRVVNPLNGACAFFPDTLKVEGGTQDDAATLWQQKAVEMHSRQKVITLDDRPKENHFKGRFRPSVTNLDYSDLPVVEPEQHQETVTEYQDYLKTLREEENDTAPKPYENKTRTVRGD